MCIFTALAGNRRSTLLEIIADYYYARAAGRAKKSPAASQQQPQSQQISAISARNGAVPASSSGSRSALDMMVTGKATGSTFKSISAATPKSTNGRPVVGLSSLSADREREETLKKDREKEEEQRKREELRIQEEHERKAKEKEREQEKEKEKEREKAERAAAVESTAHGRDAQKDEEERISSVQESDTEKEKKQPDTEKKKPEKPAQTGAPHGPILIQPKTKSEWDYFTVAQSSFSLQKGIIMFAFLESNLCLCVFEHSHIVRVMSAHRGTQDT